MGAVNKNPKLYVLHGWAYSTEKWSPFLKILSKNGVYLELLKIPGLTAPLPEPWNIDDYVNWLENSTKNHKKIILLGHSNGGRIISAFASKHPSKISKVVLVDAAGINHSDVLSKTRRVFFKTLAKSIKKVTLSKTLRKVLYKVAGESDYENANEVVKKTMINLISIDFAKFYSQIVAPTLIIWGKKDKLTPLSDGIVINRLVQNSNLIVFENARHAPQFTEPERAAQLVIDFINN